MARRSPELPRRKTLRRVLAGVVLLLFLVPGIRAQEAESAGDAASSTAGPVGVEYRDRALSEEGARPSGAFGGIASDDWLADWKKAGLGSLRGVGIATGIVVLLYWLRRRRTMRT